MSNSPQKAKAIVLGDKGVGKSTIRDNYKDLYQYRQNNIKLNVDVAVAQVTIDSMEYLIQIWDPGIPSQFAAVRKVLYTGASAAIIVYDATNRQSFNNIIYWVENFWSFNGHGPAPALIIANKSDLSTSTSVPFSEAELLVNHLNHLPQSDGFVIKLLETDMFQPKKTEQAIDVLWEDMIQFRSKRTHKP